MENPASIFLKLEKFIKKYYINELLRGTIFFIGIGLMYFIFICSVEYFLWLKPFARTFLFVIFIMVECLFLFRYILFPLFKLCKVQKGIDYNTAAILIGQHFALVSDTLTNFLQLQNDSRKSDLLAASIEQKANNLRVIPFASAINFKANRRFLPLALVPILFVVILLFSGKSAIFSQPYNRIVHFKKQFSPPAPFEFIIANSSLKTMQNKDFILEVKAVGTIMPADVKVFIGTESYYMKKNATGNFQYVFTKPVVSVIFHVEANSVASKDFVLNVVAVPSISNFEMVMHFPSYLNKPAVIVKGNGNAIVPDGTAVTWQLVTEATDKIVLAHNQIVTTFSKVNNIFSLSKKVSQNIDYQIVTSNKHIQNYEQFSYQIAIIKDQLPTIVANNAPDSVKVDKSFVIGQISDDIGLSKLQVVYYPKANPSDSKRGAIRIKASMYDRFVFQFPANLPINDGVPYEYYFEVFDNDAPHGYKSSKSSVFTYRENTQIEKEDNIFKQQNDNINSLSKSLQTQSKQLSELDKLRNLGKEKDNLDFKDQRKVDDFIERQKRQDELMKQYTEKIKNNLEQSKAEKKVEIKALLNDRLEKTKESIDANKKLLDELNKLNQKLSKEELFDKIEKFKQTAKNQTKSLQQLVELTKRFYVEKKVEQIAKKLYDLAIKQDKIVDVEKDNNIEKQFEISKEFDGLQDELNELKKENRDLKKPLDLPSTDSKEKAIDDDLKKAIEDLKNGTKSAAKSKQKSAAKKMKQLSSDMQTEMDGGDKEQMEEDVVMLRQILDNLVAFSFSQEAVMKQFKSLKRGSPSYNTNLKLQQDLKQQFKHVDDSLFALSLRNPKFQEDITNEVGNVQYNVDKAIESLADANVDKGVSYQQFAEGASNRLADFLANILTNMQMSLSMKGSGKGQGMPSPSKGAGSGSQLPDIIQKQGDLSEKAKKGIEKGNKSVDGKDGNQGNAGDGKEGNRLGDKGSMGKAGKNGAGSGSGQSNKDGENGDVDEKNALQVMQIYKEQQQLREALQNELIKYGLGGQGQSAIDQMKQLEKQLLNKGFNNEVLQNMLNLKYELLKLDKAIQSQGEDSKRQAETNKKEFNGVRELLPIRLQDYINSIEILNRQTVPLQPNYNQRVQKYFKANDQF